MSLGKVYSVWCDAASSPRCVSWVAQETTSQAARRVAKAQGWAREVGSSNRDSRDICPPCHKEGENA